jgi:hypothetical protein
VNTPVELGAPVNVGLLHTYVLAISPVILLLVEPSTTGTSAVSFIVASAGICDILILAMLNPYSGA